MDIRTMVECCFDRSRGVLIGGKDWKDDDGRQIDIVAWRGLMVV